MTPDSPDELTRLLQLSETEFSMTAAHAASLGYTESAIKDAREVRVWIHQLDVQSASKAYNAVAGWFVGGISLLAGIGCLVFDWRPEDVAQAHATGWGLLLIAGIALTVRFAQNARSKELMNKYFDALETFDISRSVTESWRK
ncbi:hypothetical protein [Luteimicrobium subarcticum]|uniref:Uncharacterized protein n=1 Tax=Luteimicrobium subarcticum TaxID=620910 RepID=A0A2M8WUK6_9MICO|nr:hypothetical protein [Luteimicrobium subarcticum]PJI94621.1 hypothetical protein CLV34_0466 [Luteimicrobium subarcticum]